MLYHLGSTKIKGGDLFWKPLWKMFSDVQNTKKKIFEKGVAKLKGPKINGAKIQGVSNLSENRWAISYSNDVYVPEVQFETRMCLEVLWLSLLVFEVFL